MHLSVLHRVALLTVSALAAALLSATVPASAQAPAAPPLGAMIVLDGSAAMTGKLGAKTKIDVARATLVTALANPPPQLAIGLVAYGHRQKSSCSDVEVLVPPAQGSTTAIKTAAAALKPTGRAPMLAGVKLAADTLDYTNAKATIVLVTNGVEDCAGGSICDAATDLKDSAFDLTIHVIGLGLTDAQRATVSCLATTTGGLYLDASNPDQLVAALNKAVIVEPVLALPKAKLTVPASAVQGTTFQVSFTGPQEKGDQVQIAWPSMKAGDYITSVLVKMDGKPGTFTAPAEIGTYEIRYWYASRDKVIAKETVTVTKVVAKLVAPAKVGQGTVFEAQWFGKVAKNDVIEIVKRGAPAGSALSVGRMREDSGKARLDAPAEPGVYDIRFHAGVGNALLGTQAIEVIPVDVTLTLPPTVAGGTDFKVLWKGPAAAADEVQLAVPAMKDGESIAGFRLGAPGRPVSLPAPAAGGNFEVRYWSGKFNKVLARTPVTIGAAAPATLDAPAEANGGGKLTVKWTGPAARGDEIQIARADMAPGDRLTSADLPLDGSPAAINVPDTAGAFVLRYWSTHSRSVLATRPIAIKAVPATMDVSAPVKAGRPFAVAWKGPGGRFDEVRVAAATSDPRDAIHFSLVGPAGQPVTILAPDKAGSYVLRYWSAGTRTVLASQTITVQ